MSAENENTEIQKTTVAETQKLQGIGGWLLFFVIGTFLSALWNFMISTQSGESSFFTYTEILIPNPAFAVVLGFFGLATGIMLIAVRNMYSVWLARIYMLVYLIGSIIIALIGLEAPSGYYIIDEEEMIIRGIAYAVLFNLIWQSYFIKSKRVKTNYKIPALTEGITEMQVGNSLTSVFNRKAFGVNYLIGVGIFIALVLSGFLWSVSDSIWWDSTFVFITSYFFLFRIPILILYSILFVLLLHLLKNDWLIALSVGLGTMVVSYLMRLIYNGVSFGQITITSIEVGNLFSFFSWSFILVVSIILALKTWGLKWWSLALWICIGNLFEGVIVQLIDVTRYEGFTFDFIFIPMSFIDGILFGSAFFLCISLFLKRKKVQMA